MTEVGKTQAASRYVTFSNKSVVPVARGQYLLYVTIPVVQLIHCGSVTLPELDIFNHLLTQGVDQ